MNKLVLFDIDKTLIPSSRAHHQSFSEAFKKVYGIDTTIEIINHHGMTEQQVIIEVLKKKRTERTKDKSQNKRIYEGDGGFF